MSLFSKKKAPRRQFRKKVVHSLDDEEEPNTVDPQEQSNGSVEVPDSSKQAASVNPPGGPRTVLSFEDDLGADVSEFKVKKTSHSKRVAKMLEREKKKEERQRRLEVTTIRDGSSGSDEDSTQLSSLPHRMSAGYIPDSTMIHAARQKREMARKMGPNPDFLSLSNDSKSTKDSAKGKSRLVREDDDDKSDDSETEIGGRGGVFGERKKVSRQMEVLTAMEEAGSGSDEDRFIEEQISKAVKGRVVSDMPTNVQQPVLSAINQSFAYGSAYSGASEFAPPTMDTPPIQQSAHYSIPEKLVPITMETLKSRLSRQLTDLQELHSSHDRRVKEMESDLVTAEREVDELEDHINMASIEYQFYQETKGYVRDLLSCLSEKVPEVNKLEQTLHSVLGQLTEIRIERRRQDVRDMADECVQATPTDHTHQVRIVEREGRRRRRREARREGGVARHYDGQSSDDEILETNRIKFKNEIDSIVSTSKAVFSDVHEDFSNLSSIKEHFEQWKHSFPSTYGHAFISLCLHKVFSPFVRLEMLAWNPLREGCGQLEDYLWFQILMFYGFQEGEDPERDDEDVQLVPNIVEKVVLPKLTALVQMAWDPLSSSQTDRLVSFLNTVTEDFPTISKTWPELINTVTMRLRQAVDSDVYIPLFATKQIDNPGSVKAIFYHRQFWSCLKLLGNITKWEGLVDANTLQELVLDGLLSRYLLLSLQNSPVSQLSVEKVKQLISLLPVSWYCDGSVVTRPLQGLVRYIVHLIDSLERAALGQNDVERTSARCSIHALTTCLITIGARSEAVTVAKQHNLKDIVSSL